MTDTPRTKAELLALFANNTTHDISPQDMRDFVASVGGLDPARSSFLWENQKAGGMDGVRDLYGTNMPITNFDPSTIGQPYLGFAEHTGSVVYHFYDPSGWLHAGTVDSPDFWGATFAASTTIDLPAGVFLYAIELGLGGTPDAGNIWRTGPFAVQDSDEISELAEGFGHYSGNYSDFWPYQRAETFKQSWQGFLMLDVPLSFFFSPQLEGPSATLSIDYGRLAITKVA